jgi:hypothetical protein
MTDGSVGGTRRERTARVAAGPMDGAPVGAAAGARAGALASIGAAAALRAAVAFAACAALPAAAGAQGLLDWPVRASAEHEALFRGAAAGLGNPAGAAEVRRGEALVLDIRGPEATQVGGVAVAGAVRLRGFVPFAALTHLGVEAIPRTGSSPTDLGEAEMRVAEDVLTLGAARTVAPGLAAGAAARVRRSEVGGSRRTEAEVGAGATFRGRGAVAPNVAVAVFGGGARPSWQAAAEAEVTSAGRPLAVRVGWGAEGIAEAAVMQRISVAGNWRGVLELSAAAVPEPGNWQPQVGGVLRLGRYRLTALRELLDHGFGAAHTLGLGLEF